MGRPLFRDLPAATIVARVTEGQIPYPIPFSDSPWGVLLADIALRALELDPNKRWSDVANIIARILRVADGHLATAEEVAALVTGGGRDSLSDAVTARATSAARAASISDDVTAPWPRSNSSLAAMITPIYTPAVGDEARKSAPPSPRETAPVSSP